MGLEIARNYMGPLVENIETEDAGSILLELNVVNRSDCYDGVEEVIIMLGREEDEAEIEILRDRFRLSTISIAEEEAKNNGMEMSEPIIVYVADLAFKYTEQLAKDLECFAQHANRKTVNMEDVTLAAHRNENLATMLRSFCNDLKGKEPQTERKRKKTSKKDESASISIQNVADV